MIRRQSLVLICIAGLSGCVAPGLGTISMDVTISGGTVLRLDLSPKGGFVPQENADIRIDHSLFKADNQTKRGFYDFGLEVKKDEILRKITVEDVTDETPLTLAVDNQPVLKDHKWTWVTREIDPTEKNVPWLYQIESGVRVFRFTILTQDGRTLVMYGAQNYPAMMKTYLRIWMGIDKPDKRP